MNERRILRGLAVIVALDAIVLAGILATMTPLWVALVAAPPLIVAVGVALSMIVAGGD